MEHIIKMLALGLPYDAIRPYCRRAAEVQFLDIIEETWSPDLVRDLARVFVRDKETKYFIRFILRAV